MFPWPDPPEPLRFDRFMAAALHDPERGYYARRIRRVGTRGDFSTTATLSPALGRAVAAWAADSLRATRCRDLIELGPGTGALAAAVRRHLPWTLRTRVRLHLVENSAPLREIQRAELGRRVRTHETVADALEACGNRACLYSNEFADAFPVRRFRRETDGWSEEFVLPAEPRWHPIPDTDLPESSGFEQKWPPGQIVEVHESYHDWLLQLGARWKRGRMLTVDYGAPAEALYHRRPLGTLRGYLHHQLLEGAELLRHPGRHDLTCDVNFTDLREWPAAFAETRHCIPQRDFLAPFMQRDRPGDRFAADPHGAGDAFLVLEQERRTAQSAKGSPYPGRALHPGKTSHPGRAPHPGRDESL